MHKIKYEITNPKPLVQRKILTFALEIRKIMSILILTTK